MKSKKDKKKNGCLKASVYLLLLLTVTACVFGAVVFSISNFDFFNENKVKISDEDPLETISAMEVLPVSSEEVSSEVSSEAVSSAEVSSEVSSQEGIALRLVTPDKSVYAVEPDKTVKISVKYSPKSATNKELEWSVDDESVATVDKDGNITGRFPGKCKVTAASKSNPEANFTVDVEVVKQGAYPSVSEHLIKVYKGSQSVVVYSKDSYGTFSVEEKIITCSTGAKGTPTKSGTYKTINKYRWRLMMGPSYGQYATSFSGSYLFHSIPCSAQRLNAMSMGGYQRLGTPASHGCVRMCVADAKWIYDNCELGTPVEVVDEAGPKGPKPVPLNWDYPGWDPTDPDPKNPYNKNKTGG